nr:isoform 2 of probable galactinol--sucrose galactosyltransferase 2 [Quercus suber]
MSEEEFQLLEGTSEKFQVVKSTKIVLDSEDANDSEDVANLEEFLDLKELVLEEHNAFPCPVQSPRILCNQPYLVLDNLSVHSLDIVYPKVSKFYNELHTSLASCGVNGFKVDLELGNGDKVSLFLGCHQDGVIFPSMFENSALTWRFLGGKPKLMFLEGLLATLMEANMYSEAFTPTNGGDNCGINDGFHSPADHNFYKEIMFKVKSIAYLLFR